MGMQELDKDTVIDRMSQALSDLQDSFNTLILRSSAFDEVYDKDFRTRLNDIRGELFRLEAEYEELTGERLNYMIGWSFRKELEEYGY